MSPHRYPDSAVFYRNLRRSFPLIASGTGCWLEDEEGKRYLDAAGGAMVVNTGHGVREIGDAMADQARALGYVNGTAFTNGPVEALAARLCALSPHFSQAYFLSSGSEAVEAALKLARQFWVEEGRPSKHKIIALTPGYHGNTLLALSASAREHYRTLYREWLVDVVQMPAPYAYRCQCAGDPGCEVCSGTILEQVIGREGAESVAVFIAEPVGGSSTGATVPRPEYFANVRAICDRYDVLFVADEVLSGAGRTGSWLALDAWGIHADITTLGKGISGGYAPLSAVLASDRVVSSIAAGTGSLVHAQTFSHHPVLCAAGVATLDYLERNALVERCRAMGEILQARLASLRELRNVGDVRGRGLLAGVELVRDPTSRAPFARQARIAERVTDTAQRHGLVVWPNVGQADGTHGDLLMIAPPFVITEEEIDQIAVRLAGAIAETMGSEGNARETVAAPDSSGG